MKLGNNEKTLILSIAICCMVMVVGYSFAYFTFGVSATGDGATIKGTAAELPEVTYEAFSDALTLTGAYPGKSASKTFTVKFKGNGSSTKETIAINLKINSNEFKLCNAVASDAQNGCDTTDTNPQLVISISGGGITSSSEINLTGQVPETIIPLATDTIDKDTEYTVKVEFRETEKNQGHNVNKSFGGTIEVEFAE